MSLLKECVEWHWFAGSGVPAQVLKRGAFDAFREFEQGRVQNPRFRVIVERLCKILLKYC